LIYIVIEGDLEIIQLAILSGVELNTHDYDLRTPLHIAGDLGYAAIFEYLASKGASLKARDRFGNVPFLRLKPRTSLKNNAFC
jgi:ankyrin repeat protein